MKIYETTHCFSILYQLLGIEDDSVVMWKCMPSTKPIISHCSSFDNNLCTSVHQNEIQQQLPRVKLTGSGKMPVMDMRSNNIIQNYGNVSQPVNYQNAMPSTTFEANHVNKSLVAQRSNHSQLAGGIHPQVSGLPPKSPVYAVVNKANKRKIETQSTTNSTSTSNQPARGEVEK